MCPRPHSSEVGTDWPSCNKADDDFPSSFISKDACKYGKIEAMLRL